MTKQKPTPLQSLLDLYDNLSHCARELGLSRQDIYYWKNLGYIPHKKGKFIEEKTSGKIKASEIWQAAGVARDLE